MRGISGGQSDGKSWVTKVQVKRRHHHGGNGGVVEAATMQGKRNTTKAWSLPDLLWARHVGS